MEWTVVGSHVLQCISFSEKKYSLNIFLHLGIFLVSTRPVVFGLFSGQGQYGHMDYDWPLRLLVFEERLVYVHLKANLRNIRTWTQGCKTLQKVTAENYFKASLGLHFYWWNIPLDVYKLTLVPFMRTLLYFFMWSCLFEIMLIYYYC